MTRINRRGNRALVAVVLASLVGLLFPVTAPAVTPTLSLPAFWERDFKGTQLKLGRVLSKNSRFTEYAVTYRSNGLKISGTLHKPAGKGPFPVVILAHGYINPEIYRTGQGLSREQEFLAERGFVALHTDYRNHASSDDDPNLMRELRLGYTADVINAAKAAKSSSLSFIDGERISLLGRSMGGGIGYNALVTAPDLFDSAILFASVSSKAAENTNKWLRSDPVVRKEIFKRYGTPEGNPTFWRNMSAYTHFSRISDPILVLHGTADDTCPIRWANEAVSRLKKLNKDVTYVKYPGAGHSFFGNTWTRSMQKTVAFIRANDN